MTPPSQPITRIREGRPEDFPQTVAMMARAFRDNAMTIACWGSNPARRERGSQLVFGAFLPVKSYPPLVAVQGEMVLGMLALAPPGTCRQMPLGPTLRVILSTLLTGPAVLNRLRVWMNAYERRDPDSLHWHVGPIAVEPTRQRAGIGSSLLERCCAIIDQDGAAAYLETDSRDNARLYERFGFRTIGTEDILGQTNWFMLREPAIGRLDRPLSGREPMRSER